MKEKKFELTDDMLDNVAGGTTTSTEVPPDAKDGFEILNDLGCEEWLTESPT